MRPHGPFDAQPSVEGARKEGRGRPHQLPTTISAAVSALKLSSVMPLPVAFHDGDMPGATYSAKSAPGGPLTSCPFSSAKAAMPRSVPGAQAVALSVQKSPSVSSKVSPFGPR